MSHPIIVVHCIIHHDTPPATVLLPLAIALAPEQALGHGLVG